MTNPFKGDREKLAKMTFPEKLDYIWTYYKFWIMIIVLTVILSVSFIRAQLAYNPEALSIILSDAYTADYNSSDAQINADFRAFINLDDSEKDPVTIDDTFATYTSAEEPAAMQMKLTAIVASGAADLMAGPKDSLVAYGTQEMYADLQTVLPEDLFNKLKEQNLLIETTYFPTEDEIAAGMKERNYYCAIDLTGNNYFETAGYQIPEAAISIIVTGKHQDKAIEFIKMILE